MSVEEWRVYIANLGKYNEGKLEGAWFKFPLDEEEIAEKIGLNDRYEEYAVHDYELPFKIDEYISIESLNEYYDMAMEMDDDILDILDELINEYGSFEEVYENKDDIVFCGCESFEDLAYELLSELGYLDGVSDVVSRYFDYESFVRDLRLADCYIETSRGIVEVR